MSETSGRSASDLIVCCFGYLFQMLFTLTCSRHLVSVVVIGKTNLDCVHLLKSKSSLKNSSELDFSSQPYPYADLRLLLFPLTPERRCSSRTFRYGYLVTT